VKWNFAAIQKSDEKYIICNADEGDPGAFMDRSTIEGDPHTVVEGMIIGGYAIGAKQGYIYIRAEYPLAIQRLESAIQAARAEGFLGKGIFGTDWDFDLEIRLGAGAFVCGEETALIRSLEGNRGMPQPRPPYPAVRGLWGKPTVINNVETFANVPVVILQGPEWFASIGTDKSKGTKVFALAGQVCNTGLVEVPMGTTLRDVVYGVGGGIREGKRLKAVQTGGPAGGCLPESFLDTPVDYESLTAAGSIMGSGGMIVIDECSCMVDVARFFVDFTQDESCGKCTPCREGTKRMLEILNRIVSGNGAEGDIEKLLRLGDTIKRASLCGLGQASPNPVISTIKHFRDEYEAHIRDKRCPAGVCKALLTYTIIPDKCTGCGACRRKCPAGCISGKPKELHEIDQEACIRCGRCFDVCKFDAVGRE
jgi:NADH:ubiquinone oxidoreductase subunit F (NADH-binding)